PGQETRRVGPAVAQAFDANGQPTKAALGSAAARGTTVEARQQVDGPTRKVRPCVGPKPGADTGSLLPAIVRSSLRTLPIARRMRWGSGDEEFVRPVHWVVMMFGSAVIEAEILGIRAGKFTHGHRFHAPRKLALRSPSAYRSTLLEKGFVVADVEERRTRIREGVTELARRLGGEAVIDPDLLDEVTALVEWPEPIAGRFDEQYLQLPPEVPIAT